MRCTHIIHQQVPETYQDFSYRCTREAKAGMNVCWQHTEEKVAMQAKRAHDRATA